MDRLGIVVPCYNEEAVLPETSKRMLELFDTMKSDGLINDKSRIVFVDDGSKDKTWSIIDSLAKEHTEIAGVKLAHNAGHQNAGAGAVQLTEQVGHGRSADAADPAAGTLGDDNHHHGTGDTKPGGDATHCVGVLGGAPDVGGTQHGQSQGNTYVGDAQTTAGQSEAVIRSGGFLISDVQINTDADDGHDLVNNNCDQNTKMHNKLLSFSYY